MDQARVASLYEDYGGRLCAIMSSRFGVPHSEAENLLHDIFATMLKTGSVVDNAEKWLVGAACNASRNYLRKSSRMDMVNLEAIPVRTEAAIDRSLTATQILDKLTDRERDALRMKYVDGFTGREIARRIGTSEGYTNVLIHRSLSKARALASEEEDDA